MVFISTTDPNIRRRPSGGSYGRHTEQTSVHQGDRMNDNAGDDGTVPTPSSADAASSPAPPPPPLSGWIAPLPGGEAATFEPNAMSAPYQAPPAKPFWRRHLVRIIVLSIVAAVIIGGWVASRGKIKATDLKAGQCFDLAIGKSFSEVDERSCNKDHDAEVVAQLVVVSAFSVPNFGTTASSTPELSEAERRCAVEFPKYLGGPLDVQLYSPRIFTLKSGALNEKAWCVVRASDGGKRNKSVKGSAATSG